MINPFWKAARERALWERSLTKETYRVSEAAEVMNMSERRVRKLLKDGELYSTKVSDRNTLIPREAIIEYMVPPLFKGIF